MNGAAELAARLNARPSGNGWIAHCPNPGHGQGRGDRSRSLSISEGDDGKLLLCCHAGCSFEDIRREAGIEGPAIPAASKARSTLVKTFTYYDAEGVPLYTKERWEPGFDGGKKSFVFRHNGQKGRGGDAVLYNLAALAEAETVFIVEGEGKADRLNSWGLTATCLDSGAKSPWRSSYADALDGKHIVILPDNDEPGRGYGERLAHSLKGKARSVKIIDLPGLREKEDIVNWARAEGNNKARLLEITEAAPEWEPSESATTAPFGEPANVREWLDTDPMPRVELFEGLLIKGVVGGLFAQGGVGKTYFLICLIIAAALGRPLFRSFRPLKPLRVLAFLGEDPDVEIHRRVKSILREFGDDIDHELLSQNLRIYCGKGAPLMKLEDGNPVATEAFNALKAEVESFQPDIVIIDPKAMFYGLDENSNDHNVQWVITLRELTTWGASVLFSHHVTKSLSGTLELNASRGGGGLVDNSRFAANMRQLTDEDAKKYDLDEPWRYVEFRVTKNSYIPKLPGSIFFRFTEGGALEEVDLKATRTFTIIEELTSALEAEAGRGKFYTAREIARGAVLPDLTERDRKEAVKLAIEAGQLTTEITRGKGRPRTVLIPGNGLPADMTKNDLAEFII